VVLDKGLLGHAVGEDASRSHRLEPVRLDDVYAVVSVSAEKALDILMRGGGLGPERRARAVAREPVQREQPRGDRPDPTVARLEATNRIVLAHVPERVLPFPGVRRRSISHGSDLRSAAGSGQKRSSAASSRRSQRYSTCSSFSSGSQPSSTSIRNASTCT